MQQSAHSTTKPNTECCILTFDMAEFISHKTSIFHRHIAITLYANQYTYFNPTNRTLTEPTTMCALFQTNIMN